MPLQYFFYLRLVSFLAVGLGRSRLKKVLSKRLLKQCKTRNNENSVFYGAQNRSILITIVDMTPLPVLLVRLQLYTNVCTSCSLVCCNTVQCGCWVQTFRRKHEDGTKYCFESFVSAQQTTQNNNQKDPKKSLLSTLKTLNHFLMSWCNKFLIVDIQLTYSDCNC